MHPKSCSYRTTSDTEVLFSTYNILTTLIRLTHTLEENGKLILKSIYLSLLHQSGVTGHHFVMETLLCAQRDYPNSAPSLASSELQIYFV